MSTNEVADPGCQHLTAPVNGPGPCVQRLQPQLPQGEQTTQALSIYAWAPLPTFQLCWPEDQVHPLRLKSIRNPWATCHSAHIREDIHLQMLSLCEKNTNSTSVLSLMAQSKAL